MLTLSRQQLVQRWDIVPDMLRETMAADATNDFLLEISAAEHVPEEKIPMLARLTGFVLLGFMHPEELAKEISGVLSLDPKISGEIADALNRKIFIPVRADIDKAYAPVPSEAPLKPRLLEDIKAPVRVMPPSPPPAGLQEIKMPLPQTPKEPSRVSPLTFSGSAVPRPPVPPGASTPPIINAAQQPGASSFPTTPTVQTSQAPTPSAGQKPAPFMLHKESDFQPLKSSPEFRLNIPTPPSGRPSSPTEGRPAKLEIGSSAAKEAPKPQLGKIETQAPHVVNYGPLRPATPGISAATQPIAPPATTPHVTPSPQPVQPQAGTGTKPAMPQVPPTTPPKPIMPQTPPAAAPKPATPFSQIPPLTPARPQSGATPTPPSLIKTPERGGGSSSMMGVRTLISPELKAARLEIAEMPKSKEEQKPSIVNYNTYGAPAAPTTPTTPVYIPIAAQPTAQTVPVPPSSAAAMPRPAGGAAPAVQPIVVEIKSTITQTQPAPTPNAQSPLQAVPRPPAPPSISIPVNVSSPKSAGMIGGLGSVSTSSMPSSFGAKEVPLGTFIQQPAKPHGVFGKFIALIKSMFGGSRTTVPLPQPQASGAAQVTPGSSASPKPSFKPGEEVIDLSSLRIVKANGTAEKRGPELDGNTVKLN